MEHGGDLLMGLLSSKRAHDPIL